jgi:hypothetical protein
MNTNDRIIAGMEANFHSLKPEEPTERIAQKDTQWGVTNDGYKYNSKVDNINKLGRKLVAICCLKELKETGPMQLCQRLWT